jgi:pimeloyl-ACP methyl ester carboxylesterase
VQTLQKIVGFNLMQLLQKGILMRQQEVIVPHGRIVVDVHGQGQAPPIVVIPGVMSDAAAWGTVAGFLAGDREVHVMNRRGRRPSTGLPPDYSIDTEVADLNRVLANLPGPAHVFGWSLGALVALQAVASGADVLSLVLYEPVMSPFGREQVRPLQEARRINDLDSMVEIVNRDISGYDQDHVDRLRRNSRSWNHLRELAEPLADEIHALNCFTVDMQRYRSLQTPTTVLYGTASGPMYQDPCLQIANSLPLANTTALEGQDHLIHLTSPAVLAKAVRVSINEA